jgi:hypothetical protein
MAEQRVVVFLRDGSSVASEEMSDESAQHELERILSQGPRKGSAWIIKLGKKAAFRSIDFVRAEISGFVRPLSAQPRAAVKLRARSRLLQRRDHALLIEVAKRLQARFFERRGNALAPDLVRIDGQLYLARRCGVEFEDGLLVAALQQLLQAPAQTLDDRIGVAMQAHERVVELSDVGVRKRRLEVAKAKRPPLRLVVERLTAAHQL